MGQPTTTKRKTYYDFILNYNTNSSYRVFNNHELSNGFIMKILLIILTISITFIGYDAVSKAIDIHKVQSVCIAELVQMGVERSNIIALPHSTTCTIKGE